MLLVFDVGNTNIVMGVYRGKDLVISFRLSTDKAQTSDEYGIMVNSLFTYHSLSLKDVRAVVISSVVPHLMHTLENLSRRYCNLEPLVIGPGVKTGMNIKYDNPREVGADRIVNAVAGYEKYGGPLVIVDFGTATTFCAISKKGEYLGGCIAPGLGISADALFQKTAKLPRIELIKPPNLIGKNTVLAMQSGLIYGYVGLVEGIVKGLKKELSETYGKMPKVIATGGLARMISEETKEIDAIDSTLTLEGLRIIYERNITQ